MTRLMGGPLLHVLRTATVEEPTDRRLLEGYARAGDEAAFARLVRRHAGLVYGVCRRSLGNEHDVEDAFQAVFLILARKARIVAWQESIGPWLYGVATRVAAKARCRKFRDRLVPANGYEPAAPIEGSLPDLGPALDLELQRLPARYRLPVVLCHLEGKSNAAAARELGVTEGALRGRLYRGLEILRGRLTGKGFAASVLLSAAAGSLAVPRTLVAPAISAALRYAAGRPPLASANTMNLTREALTSMFVAKIRIPTLAFAFLAAAALISGLARSHGIAAPTDAPVADAKTIPNPADEHRLVEPTGVRGTIKVVDSKRTPKAVTIEISDRVLLSLDLAKDAKTLVAGRAATLADLAEGTEVTAVLGDDHRTVLRIEAEGKTEEGQIAKIDVAAGTIEFADEDEKKTITIAKDASIFIDGYKSRLEDLADCKEATVEFAADGKTVARVKAVWEQDSDLRARISEIDAATGVVKVKTEGDLLDEIKLKANGETKIFVNGQPAKLADLKAKWDVVIRDKDRSGETIAVIRAVKRDPKADDDE